MLHQKLLFGSIISTLTLMIFFSSCSNNNAGKDMGINGKTEPKDMIKEVAADTFRNTKDSYTEYTSFEISEKGYDPCELLTMQSITTTCKPTSAVNIFNQNKAVEKVCIYSWMGTDGKICQVKFTILAYSLNNDKLVSLFKPDKDGLITHSNSGVRWIVSNKVLSVSYIGEVIKKVNILDIKSHVKPFK